MRSVSFNTNQTSPVTSRTTGLPSSPSISSPSFTSSASFGPRKEETTQQLKIAIPEVKHHHTHYHTHYQGVVGGISSPQNKEPFWSIGIMGSRRRRATPWCILLTLFILSMLSTFGRYSHELAAWKPWISTNVAYKVPPAKLLKSEQFTHLIIVAGHAVFLGSSRESYWDAKKHVSTPHLWAMDKFQLQSSDQHVKFFVDSVKVGMDIAARDASSILMFSGGKTRLDAGMISEALGMWQVADILGWPLVGLKERTLTEEFAKDSLDNLLFSLCRFRDVTGHYPTKITVISMNHKRLRFMYLHSKAIKWPLDQFEFVGLPSPGLERVEEDLLQQATEQVVEKLEMEGFPDVDKELATYPLHEMTKSLLAFEQDPFACRGNLKGKKIDRNPFEEMSPYSNPESCPEIMSLIDRCHLDVNGKWFDGEVPW